MRAFGYARPTTLKEATGLLGAKFEEASVLAGGTDLLSAMKDEAFHTERVVSLKGLKELGGIQKTAAGLRIGAMVTLDELLSNPVIRAEYPALREAAEGVTSPQIRNMGTIGGDLCQRPRCWYFRNGHGLLAMDASGKSLVPAGDNRYHAIFPTAPAYFVSASSFGPALVALGATVKLASASGTRDVAADKFFVVPQNNQAREIALLPNEILTEIVIPGKAMKNATYEVRHREAIDWPLATASVAMGMNGKAVSSARVALGHVAPTPHIATAAEQFLAGKTITAEVAEQAGEEAVKGAQPLSQNGYKRQLAKVAVKRAVLTAAGMM